MRWPAIVKDLSFRGIARADPLESAFAARLVGFLWVVGSTWAFFAALNASKGRGPSSRWQLVLAIGTIGLRYLAIRPGATAEGMRMAGHAALVLSVFGLFLFSLTSGQHLANGPWFFAAVPLFAAYLLGVRASFGWTVVVVGTIVAIHHSDRWVVLEPLFVPDRLDQMQAQIAFGVLLLALGAASRRVTDNTLAALHAQARVLDDRAREIAAARDEALAAARAKSAFLATMSHEIRTPLNAVVGLTGVLADTPLAGEQRDLVQTIHRSGEDLLAIVNDILDYSKIEAGRVVLERAPFDVEEAVADAVDLFGPAAWSRDVDLAFHLSPGVPARVVGDVARLRQILVNLISNAVKFTPSGEVVVSVDAPSALALRFQVRDTGIGIAPAAQDRLFEPFHQADASTTRQYGGTGLGLAISRELVERMGGTLSLVSAPGAGTTFTVDLPVTPCDDETTWLPDDNPVRGRSLLILEPRPASRAVLVSLAEELGMRVSTAEDASEPDVALVSGALPDLVDRCAHLARRAPSARILVLTPIARDLPPGAAGWCHVPVRRRQLWRLLEAVLSGRPTEPPRAVSTFDPELAERHPLALLVADDNPVNLKVAVTILRRLGYQPDTASTGYEVLAALERRTYDLVLLDMQMPEMDGATAARRIREAAHGPRLVALTAGVLPEQRAAALDAGMDGFLGKPLRLEQLVDVLRDASRARASASVPPAPARHGAAFASLDSLRALYGDDEAQIAALVDTFAVDGDRLLDRARDALARDDATGVERAAHSLKSTTALFGAAHASTLSEQLEALGRRGDLAAAAPILKDLQQAIASTTAELRRQVVGSADRPG